MSKWLKNPPPIAKNNLEPGSRALQEHLAHQYPSPPPLPSVDNLLEPLLEALKWQGTKEQIAEALPHVDSVETINDLRRVLHSLNYQTKPLRRSIKSLRTRDFPFLFATNDRKIYIVLSKTDANKYIVLSSTFLQPKVIDLEGCKGDTYLIEEMNIELLEREVEKNGWVNTLSKRFYPQFYLLAFLTFIIGALSLALPVFVISVYDNIISTNSVETLIYAVTGMSLIIALELIVRYQRLKIIAYIGARIEYLLVRKAFQHIIKLPISTIRVAPIGAQITRIKQFEGITSIFTGTLADAFLDIPLLLLLVITSFVIGGTLGWVSVGLILTYLIIGVATISIVRHQVSETGEAKSKSRNFLLETFSKHKSLFYNGKIENWIQRYSEHWATYRQHQFISTNTNILLHTISQALVVLAGILILSLGTQKVIEGTLSIGALIALMIIVWKVLSPIQKLYLGMHKIGQIKESLQQINFLTQLKPEQKLDSSKPWHRKFKGDYIVSNIALRYTPESDPVLRNINFKVKPGEMIAITGPSGSGKSTLLKVLLGLYQPQLGVIHLDNLDLRQIELSELRHSISYAPQAAHFFYGTIRQNLEFSNATATQESLEQVLKELKLLDPIQALPDGINMRLKAKSKHHLSPEMRQQLSLARALIKNSHIYFLDTPTSNLGKEAKVAFIEKMRALKGKSTIVMVTHDKDLLMLANRVMILTKGIIVADKPPEEIIKISG